MKRIILANLLLMVATIAQGQLKVSASGTFGTTTNVPLVFDVNNVKSGSTGSASISSVSFGYETLLSSIGTCNTAFGWKAMRNTTGSYNTAVGYAALFEPQMSPSARMRLVLIRRPVITLRWEQVRFKVIPPEAITPPLALLRLVTIRQEAVIAPLVLAHLTIMLLATGIQLLVVGLLTV